MSALSAFLTSLVINVVVGAIVLLLFSWLRTRNPMIYAPRINHFKQNKPPALPSGFFAWIPAVLRISQVDLLTYGGADAVMFVTFLRASMKLFGILSVVSCVAVIPTNATGGNSDASSLDKISLAHIDEDSDRLWVHFVMVYAVVFLTFTLMRGVWKDYVAIRHAVLSRTGEDAVSTRSVLTFGLDDDVDTNDKLRSLFEAAYPGQVHSVSLVRKAKAVDKVFEQRNKLVAQLEAAREKLARTGKAEHKAGARCFCFGGRKVKSVEYYAKELGKTTAKLSEMRRDSYEPAGAGIVTFNSLAATTTAVQTRLTASGASATVQAPEPLDILWGNASLPDNAKLTRQTLSTAMTWALVLFWTIPVAFVSSLSNLEALSANKGLRWLEPLFANATVTGLVEGYLPTIVLAVFNVLLPVILAAFTKFEGVHSFTLVELGTLRKFFLFVIINSLLILSISGAVFDSLEELIDEPTSVVELLATSLPSMSTFFLSYILLVALTGLPLALLRVGPLVVTWLKLKYLAKTPRAIDETYNAAAGFVLYSRVGPATLFVTVVATVFSVMQPLTCVAATVYFALAVLVFSYNSVYCFNPAYETGGRLWPILFDRVIVGLYVFVVLMIGVIGLKKAATQSALLIPLLFFIAAFRFLCQRDYAAPGAVLPMVYARDSDAQSVEVQVQSPITAAGSQGAAGADGEAKASPGAGSEGAGAGAGTPAAAGSEAKSEEASRGATEPMDSSVYQRPSLVPTYDLVPDVVKPAHVRSPPAVPVQLLGDDMVSRITSATALVPKPKASA